MKKLGFRKDDRGITYTEFGLFGVLLSIALVFFLTDVGDNVMKTYMETEQTRQEL